MKASDFVVSFRFPLDDFFVRHETNVCARNRSEAMQIVGRYLVDAIEMDAIQGVVMLYGKPYTTIRTDVKRSKQIQMVNIRRELQRRENRK